MHVVWSLLFLITCVRTVQNFECISLGECCTTAAALQKWNLRNAAYPFDWTITPFSSLTEVLSDDFQDYLNPNYFKIRGDKHGIINKYGSVFVHDFLTVAYTGNNLQHEDNISEDVLASNWLTYLPDIQAKYARRITRFLNQCHEHHKIYFFRHLGTSREQACMLRKLLEEKYPKLNFVLVIVGNSPHYAKPWHEHKIKNYYLNDSQVWNNPDEWKRILDDLQLL